VCVCVCVCVCVREREREREIERESGFVELIRISRDQSFANAGSSNITRLPMLTVCHESVWLFYCYVIVIVLDVVCWLLSVTTPSVVILNVIAPTS
jgi:hypothetical protein